MMNAYLKVVFTLLISLSILSCTEQQTFDNTFKLTMAQSLAGYCNQNDMTCIKKVNKQIDLCFESIDYNTQKLYQSTKNNDWSNPKQAMGKTNSMEIEQFGKRLNDCMAHNIGGSFAKNLKQGNSSWESDVKITRSTNQAKFSPKKNSSILITIKDNGDIWLNKNTVKIKDLKSMVKDLTNKNPDLYAVIIADRNSSTSDLVRVMDQLKSAGIENISIAATKPN